jgi:hypothetical protein
MSTDDYDIKAVTTNRIFCTVTITAIRSYEVLDPEPGLEYAKLMDKAKAYLEERGFTPEGDVTLFNTDLSFFSVKIGVTMTGWKDE